MKKILLTIFFLSFIFFGGYSQQVFAPVPVTKTKTNKIYVHVMPWFETPASNGGTWGYHWKMNTKNPNNILANDQRDIAAWFYPQIEPYASGDADVVEYQLLLMKLSGIDGVMIDWYGTQNIYDYPKNKTNAEKMIALLQKVGLKYSIVYEDATLNNASNKSLAAKNDLAYMQSNYFSQSNYETYNSKPLLLVFGPQGLIGQSAWADAFSGLNPTPSFFPLWYDNDAGNTATGSYAWIYSDYLTGLNSYYNNASFPVKIGSVYPGFKTYYSAGGASGPTWEIAHNGTTAFNATLDLALSKNLAFIQLNTWNDYGEGSMIEPTKEFGYSFLTSLQQKLGVSGLSQTDLELIKTLYDQRKQYAGNATEQARLDQVFYYIVSLQMTLARNLLLNIQPPDPLPYPWKNADIGTVAATGSATLSNDTFTIRGSGVDIYGAADAFHYVYQQVTGDVTIVAKINSLTNTDVWAKTGLMIRESIAAGAVNAAVVITPSNGINFQYRTATNGATTNEGGNTNAAPYWLKLERKANLIKASYSYSGNENSWLEVGSVSIAMSSVYVGMPVTSHSDGSLTTSVVTNVTVTAPPVINSFTPAYGQTGSIITIKGRFFAGATVVGFGGTPASSFTVVSDSVITGIVGTGESGPVNVSTANGDATLAGFSYQLCNASSTTLTAGITGSNYQWQINTGSGFVNVSDNSNYSGSASSVLNLNNLPSSWNGYQYRCVVDGNNSNIYSLKFVNTWLGTVNDAWENAANWSCGAIPDSNTDVVIGYNANVIINSDRTVRSLTVKPGATVQVNTGYKVVINH